MITHLFGGYGTHLEILLEVSCWVTLPQKIRTVLISIEKVQHWCFFFQRPIVEFQTNKCIVNKYLLNFHGDPEYKIYTEP